MYKFSVGKSRKEAISWIKNLRDEDGNRPYDFSPLGFRVRFWNIEDAITFSLKFGEKEDSNIHDDMFLEGHKDANINA